MLWATLSKRGKPPTKKGGGSYFQGDGYKTVVGPTNFSALAEKPSKNGGFEKNKVQAPRAGVNFD